MDLRELKQDFGARILFNGCIDSHKVLIEGTPATVQEDTRAVLEIMAPNGGFVAGASHDTNLEETPLQNVLAIFDTIRNTGTASGLCQMLVYTENRPFDVKRTVYT